MHANIKQTATECGQQPGHPQPLIGGRNDCCGLCSEQVAEIENEQLRTGLNCVLCPDCYWNSSYYSPRQVRLVASEVIVDAIEFQTTVNSPFGESRVGPVLLGAGGNVPATHRSVVDIFERVPEDGLCLLVAALAKAVPPTYTVVEADNPLLAGGIRNNEVKMLSRYISRPFVLEHSKLIYDPSKIGLAKTDVREKLQDTTGETQQADIGDF